MSLSRPTSVALMALALLTASPALAGERFMDNGDGTVMDHQTGLTWMRLADCWGQQGWMAAQANVAGLNSGQKGCAGYHGQAKDWRLPTAQELLALTDPKTPHDNVALPAGHPFENPRQGHYWTGEEKDAQTAWYINLHNGHKDFNGKEQTGYVWPVRGPGH